MKEIKRAWLNLKYHIEAQADIQVGAFDIMINALDENEIAKRLSLKYLNEESLDIEPNFKRFFVWLDGRE